MSKRNTVWSFSLILLWKEAWRLWPWLFLVALQWVSTPPSSYKRWVSRFKPTQHLLQKYPRVRWECCDLGKTSHPQEWLCHHCRHPIWTTHTHVWRVGVECQISAGLTGGGCNAGLWGPDGPPAPAEDPGVWDVLTRQHFQYLNVCKSAYKLSIYYVRLKKQPCNISSNK